MRKFSVCLAVMLGVLFLFSLSMAQPVDNLLPLPPGEYKYFILGELDKVDPRAPNAAGFSETAKNVIKKAIQDGPFKRFYSCTGISFKEVSTPQEANLWIWRKPLQPKPDLKGNLRDLPSGFIQIPGTQFAEIVINTNLLKLHDKETVMNIPRDAYDLYTLVVHELSHYLGIPAQENQNYPPHGMFDDEIGPGDIVRDLAPEDVALFILEYPKCGGTTVFPTVSLSCRPEHLVGVNFFLHITATIPAPATARMTIRLEVTSASGPKVDPEIGHPVIIEMFPGENTRTERTGGLCGEFDPNIGWVGKCSIRYTVKSARFDGGLDIPSETGQSVLCAFGH